MVDEKFTGELKECSVNALFNEDMKKHTTFKIGGCADCLINAASVSEISAVVSLCRRYGVPYIVIGSGSNLLVGDGGIRGVVIKTGKMCACRVQDERIYADCGISLSHLASEAMKNSLSGLEFAGGIPGTLGGGIYMNAGAYGSEMADVVESVTYMDADANVMTVGRDKLDMGYRKSMFINSDFVILSCVMKLKHDLIENIREKMREFSRRRMEKQPLTLPSAGSTFKRPDGNFAGKLIEDAGLKGFSIGGAQISTKHGGFVINTGCATAKDVMDVIDHVQKKVSSKFGVNLEPEIRFVGEEK